MDQEPEQPGRLDRHVMLVGAGLMGAQIGCEYALGGCAVTWVVRERANAERRIEQALALALAHGLATPEQTRCEPARRCASRASKKKSGAARADRRVLARAALPEGRCARSALRALSRCAAREQHLLDRDQHARRCCRYARAHARHPLLEPAAADGAGRGTCCCGHARRRASRWSICCARSASAPSCSSARCRGCSGTAAARGAA